MGDISVTFKTELINQVEQDKNSDGILLLGTATDGPVMEIVQVHDALMMHDVYDSGELVRAYGEATLHGADNIYIMRITGKGSSLTVLEDSTEEELFTITSVHGGEKYNDNFALVTDSTIVLSYIFGQTVGSNTIAYKSTDTIDGICYKINSYSYLHGCVATPKKQGTFVLKQETYLSSSGEDEKELTGRQREAALNNAYNVLKSNPKKFKIVVPLRATVNDPRIDFIGPLDELCRERSHSTLSTIGVIGAEIGNYSAMITRITRKPMTCYLNTICIYSNATLEAFNYNDQQELNSSTYVCTTPEAVLAGLIAKTPITSSINNKQVNLMLESIPLTTEEKGALARLGINTFDYVIGRGYCVRGGKTVAYSADLSEISYLRLVLYIQDKIREIAEGGIGENINLFAKRESKINEFMDALSQQKVIKAYNLNVEYKNNDTVEIFGDITPIGSIRSIAIDVTMIVQRY